MALRALLVSGAWWALTDGDPAGLPLGAPIVLAAIASSVALAAPPSTTTTPRWRLLGALRLGLAFVLGSVLGGIDVARRAVMPRLSLSPAMIEHPLRLPAGEARNFYTALLCLMPGTLSAHVDEDLLVVHTLDDGHDVAATLSAFEQRVAAALGVPLTPEPAHA